MIPPRGFKNEIYPLRHRLIYSLGLSAITETMNSVYLTLVNSTTEDLTAPEEIEVNPHNTAYNKDGGAIVQKMSIIDKLTLSLRFNMTANTEVSHHSSGTSTNEIFNGSGLNHIRLYWRPIFFSFKDKLERADDDTGTTVEAILALTKDDTNKTVVPLTTNKLSVVGPSELPQPFSTVNVTEDLADYNMTSTSAMEDHVWDEDLFREAMMRYTNKGALAACVGRTRTVNLTRARPFHNVYIRKFVPRAIRRVMEYTHMGIQIHIPISSDVDQDYIAIAGNPSLADVGVKAVCQYHEWNADHYQLMEGTGP